MAVEKKYPQRSKAFISKYGNCDLKRILIYIGLFLFAVCWDNIDYSGYMINQVRNVIIYLIYVGIFISWGEFIQSRIVGRQVKFYMQLIIILMISFVLIRSIKFRIEYVSPVLIRYLWYSYYIPILLIAMLSFWLTRFVGKSEDYKPNWTYKLTAIPTILLILGVMTNEFHQKAFILIGSPYSLDWKDDYKHNIIYYLIVLWVLALVVSIIFSLYRKCRKYGSYNQLYVMFGIITLGLLYCFMYVVLSFRAIEMMVAVCFMIIAFWEGTIQTRLFPTNKDYDWCFYHGTMNAQILDKSGQAVFNSNMAEPVDELEFNALKDNGSILLDNEHELSMHKINGGYVVWKQNIGDIARLMEELRDTQQSIMDAADALNNNIRVEAEKESVRTKSRLYSKILKHIQPHLILMKQMLDLAQAASDEEFPELMYRVNIIGVYVKRCSNMILLGGQQGIDFGAELKLCFRETFDNIVNSGINADFMFRKIPEIDLKQALIIYDYLESVIEGCIGNIDELFAILSDNEKEIRFTVSLKGKTETDCFYRKPADKNVYIETEDAKNGYCASLIIKKEVIR